jgi:hypothetical protein
MYKESEKLTPQRVNNPLDKWENEPNRQFSKEETKIVINTQGNAQHSWPQKKCKSKGH